MSFLVNQAHAVPMSVLASIMEVPRMMLLLMLFVEGANGSSPATPCSGHVP